MIIGHRPLTDPVIQDEIFKLLKIITPESVDLNIWDSKNYFNSFRNWITSSSKNTVYGFDDFQHNAYCAGTYDGIQSFIHRHVTTRRIRFSRAEFVGSKIISNNAQAKWCYLEDDALDKNDALVLSLPFSGNGNCYSGHDSILKECSNLNIPVLIDLAYFGISSGLNIDLSHKCISDVVCSLSKPMIAQFRLGLRLTRDYHDDQIQSLSDSKTYNRIAVIIAINLLNKFSHDWIVDRYLPKQQKICKHFNITPTQTLTLALGDSTNYPNYFRSGYYRICITDELLQDIYN